MELNRPFSLSFLPQNRLAIYQVKRTSPERYVECIMQIFTSETFWIQLCLCQCLALFLRNYSRYFFACLIANAGVGFGAWFATASLHQWEWIMKLWSFYSSSKCQRCGQWNFKVVKMLRRLCWPVTRLIACATLSFDTFRLCMLWRALRSDLLVNICHRLHSQAHCSNYVFTKPRYPHQRRWQTIPSLFSDLSANRRSVRV